jgi:hypothetical protein
LKTASAAPADSTTALFSVDPAAPPPPLSPPDPKKALQQLRKSDEARDAAEALHRPREVPLPVRDPPSLEGRACRPRDDDDESDVRAAQDASEAAAERDAQKNAVGNARYPAATNPMIAPLPDGPYFIASGHATVHAEHTAANAAIERALGPRQHPQLSAGGDRSGGPPPYGDGASCVVAASARSE